VTGGASAIYGSDAVGGVVNVILRKDYNGWEANVHFGYSDNNGHYAERIGSLVGGASNGTTSVTVSAEYSQTDPITFGNRPYTNPYYATTYYPGIIDIYNASSGNDEFYRLAAGHNAPPGGAAYTIDQLVSMGYYTDLGSANSAAVIQKVEEGFNLADKQALQQRNKRQSATIDFEHRVFGDSLTVFGDVIYSHTVTDSSLNAQPDFPYISTPDADLIEYGVTPPSFGTEYIPVTAPGNPFSEAYIDQGVSDGSAGNGILAHTRFVQFPRLFENDSTLYRIEGGLRGKINDDFSWEMGADINRYQLNYTNSNLLDLNAFIGALSSGQLNPFALTQAPGILPGKILGTAYVNYTSTLNSYDAVLRGSLFELPAGKVKFAAGASITRENLTACPTSTRPTRAGSTPRRCFPSTITGGSTLGLRRSKSRSSRTRRWPTRSMSTPPAATRTTRGSEARASPRLTSSTSRSTTISRSGRRRQVVHRPDAVRPLRAGHLGLLREHHLHRGERHHLQPGPVPVRQRLESRR
jgi:iron complex outermembrane receptor protein